MGADLRMSTIASCNLSLPDLAEEGNIPGVFNVIFSGQKRGHTRLETDVIVDSLVLPTLQWHNQNVILEGRGDRAVRASPLGIMGFVPA